MRPRGGSLSTFRTLLHLTAFLLLIGSVPVLPASAQGTALPQSGQAKPAPILATQKTETGLMVKQLWFNTMFIGDKGYTLSRHARFYALDGRLIKPFQVKPGDTVDIQYLTGGTKTEMWPHYPNERVLTILRIVPKPRQ